MRACGLASASTHASSAAALAGSNSRNARNRQPITISSGTRKNHSGA
ncbi:hypothetical protein [Ereboglobus luteus]|nr:hypothetical protein [Ereboglobus luteus]